MGFFSRIGNLLRGKGLKAVEAAELADPKAMLASEVERFNKAQADFNSNLGKQAGMIERLKAQIIKGEKDKAAITGRIQALLKVEDGRAKAADLALQLQGIKTSLEDNGKQRADAEALYQQLTKQRDTFVKDASVKIERIKSKISQAEMADAQAELAKMTTSVQFNPDGQSLGALEESLDKKVSEAQGTVRVAQDAINASPWAQTEAEQKAAGENALAEFEASLK